MKYVGAHVSATGGVSKAPINAHEINAKAFALSLMARAIRGHSPLPPW